MAKLRKNKVQIIGLLSALTGVALTGISLLSWPTSIQFLLPVAWVLGPLLCFCALTAWFQNDFRGVYRQKSKMLDKVGLDNNRKKFVLAICSMALISMVLIVVSSLLLQHTTQLIVQITAGVGAGIGGLSLAAMLRLAGLAIFQPKSIGRILQNTSWGTFPQLSKSHKAVFLLLTGFILVVTSLFWAFTPPLPYTITHIVIGMVIGGGPFVTIGISTLPTLRKSAPVMHASVRIHATRNAAPLDTLTNSHQVLAMQQHLTAKTAAAWTPPQDSKHLHSPTRFGSQGSSSSQVLLSQPADGSFSADEASARLEHRHGNSGIELSIS